ncbi:MAG: hypothetical protein RBU25_11720, partial [Lentisphaeria bacterium]|nr:hypothetical protein [Lentisphaeria bacterium]
MLRPFALALALCLGLAAEPLKITAYIQVQSGCQRHTEDFLAKLAKTHGDKVALEIVDFGTPEGMKRLRADGMNCMGVRLDGQQECEIVFRGVPLKVAFLKPAGFFWLHEELETAVRQKLEGVADEDRQPPPATTCADGETTTLVIGSLPTYSGTSAPPIQTAAETLNRLAREKPLIQEEFEIAAKEPGTLVLRARGQDILADPAPANAAEAAAAPLRRVV